jgi:glycosyltransferase involved in cell wall biosynthesis
MLPGPTIIVDNGVDLGRYDPTPVPREPRISLIGTLGYLPNSDGAQWFVNEVFPLIRRAVPEAVLDLVGRLAIPEVMALAEPPLVTVIPDVPDIRPYYERTRLVIVPLRVGTGTRLKALEGMAASRPVVGTTVGLAGLEVENGKHALIADDPAELAKQVVQVLTDDSLATRLAEAGRALVTERYSWERVSEPFVSAVLAARSTREDRSAASG